MIELIGLVLFVPAVLLLVLGEGSLEHRVLYLLLGFVMLMAATGNAIIYAAIPSYQITAPVLTANTLYANLNYTSISLYATGNAITAYIGNTISLHPAASGSSIYISIPHGFYYKLNYTSANIIEVDKR